MVELIQHLVTISPADGSADILLSDYDASGYNHIILGFGDIQSSAIDPISWKTSPASASFVVKNNITVSGESRFTSLTGLMFASIVIQQNGVTVFTGNIDEITNIKNGECTVNCVGVDAALSKKFEYEICDTTAYPACDPDDVGKMFPVVYGEAKRVPFIAADVGAYTTLKTVIADASSVADIYLSETSTLQESGTVIIDSEKIAYTSKNDTTKTLSGITRGANGTTATAHSIGANVGEARSEYIYLLGCPVESISDVYVNGILQESASSPPQYDVYTGNDGDDHPLYPGRGAIAFSECPIINRSVNLDIVEKLYTVEMECDSVPIGNQTDRDTCDTTTSITFPTAPSANLDNIYVDYYWEMRIVGSPAGAGWVGYEEWKIDGVMVGYFNAATGVWTPYTSSPLRVSKSAWPESAVKTASVMSGSDTGLFLNVHRVVITADSDTSDIELRGKQVAVSATNLPIGEATAKAAVDTGTSITFPDAPSGNLTGVEVSFSFSFSQIGAVVNGDNDFEIAGTKCLCCVNGVEYPYMPSDFKLFFSSWQTSLAKTASIVHAENRFKLFKITSATQRAYTDDFTNDMKLTGNSMADSIIGGVVAADVKGIIIPGISPATAISTPQQIITDIISTRCNASNVLDLEATVGYTMALVISTPPDVRELISSIAMQARSIAFFDLDGTVRMKAMNGTYSVDADITAADVRENRSNLNYTNKSFIKNKIKAFYNHYWWGKDANMNSVETEDHTASQVLYDLLEMEEDLLCIPGQTQAQNVVDWRLLDLAHPRLLMEVLGGQTNINRTLGEVLTFDTSNEYLDDQFAELVNDTDQFLLLSLTFQNDGDIKMQAVAIPSA